MAKLYFTTHIQVLNTPLPPKLHTFMYITNIVLHSFILIFTFTNTEIYHPLDDPNFTNLMVSYYDCEKKFNLRQFNLINVKLMHRSSFKYTTRYYYRPSLC